MYIICVCMYVCVRTYVCIYVCMYVYTWDGHGYTLYLMNLLIAARGELRHGDFRSHLHVCVCVCDHVRVFETLAANGGEKLQTIVIYIYIYFGYCEAHFSKQA